MAENGLVTTILGTVAAIGGALTLTLRQKGKVDTQISDMKTDIKEIKTHDSQKVHVLQFKDHIKLCDALRKVNEEAHKRIEDMQKDNTLDLKEIKETLIKIARNGKS